MQKDFLDFVTILTEHDADFVIIGGLALAFYGYPRYTGDLGIWAMPTLKNMKRIFSSIENFFDITLQVTPAEFLAGHNMIEMGEEPVKIQIHIRIDGVSNEELWENKIKGAFGNIEVFYIGKEAFIKNKKAVGRPQDLIDIEKIL